MPKSRSSQVSLTETPITIAYHAVLYAHIYVVRQPRC